MKFEIIDTTDNKHEGEIVEFEGNILPGTDLQYKEVLIKIEQVTWVNSTTVKLISSNYIAVLRLIG